MADFVSEHRNAKVGSLAKCPKCGETVQVKGDSRFPTYRKMHCSPGCGKQVTWNTDVLAPEEEQKPCNP